MKTLDQRPLLTFAAMVLTANLAGSADAATRTLASPTQGEQDVVARDTRDQASAKLSSARKPSATDFGVVHDSHARKVYIYGESGMENHAVAELVNTMIVGQVNLRVTLSKGGVASGSTLVVNIPYLQPFEATPTDDDFWLAAGPGAGPQPPKPVPMIIEVRFQGRGEADYFENLTEIPSWASGSGGNDTLIGGSAGDQLDGGSGDDILRGNGGDDELNGGFGNDEMYGGDGGDTITATASGNDSDQNLYCGQDGADTLVGAPFSTNLMDAEIAGGVYSDGYEDRIEGTSSASSYTTYEFTPGQDRIFENGIELFEGEYQYPTPDMIGCG